MLWALLAWGNRHFAPEGASFVVVDRATGTVADPVMVDRNSGKVMDPGAYRTEPGPAADAATRRRYETADAPV